MLLHTLLSAALLVCSCHGFWFFGNDDIQTATSNNRPVDESCQVHADTNNCAFYSCFEQRLPCGRDGYMTKHGLYYCNRLQAGKSTFNEQGQEFIDNAQQCMMSKLKPHYNRDYFDCHDFEHAAVRNASACFLENNFCQVFTSNARQFWRVLQVSDLFGSGMNKLWREMVRLSMQCGQELLQASVANTNQQLANTHRGFLASLQETRDSLADSLADTHSDFMDQWRQVRSQVEGSISDLVDDLTGDDDDE